MLLDYDSSICFLLDKFNNILTFKRLFWEAVQCFFVHTLFIEVIWRFPCLKISAFFEIRSEWNKSLDIDLIYLIQGNMSKPYCAYIVDIWYILDCIPGTNVPTLILSNGTVPYGWFIRFSEKLSNWVYVNFPAFRKSFLW